MDLVRECVLTFDSKKPPRERVERVLRQARSRLRAQLDAPRRAILLALWLEGRLPLDPGGMPSRPSLDLLDQGLIISQLDGHGRPSFRLAPLTPTEET